LEDLLALSRLIVTPLKLKKNNFSTLALGIAKTVSAKWGGRAIECLVDKRVTVEADSSMLRMALTHLLDNACKYSPEGGPISLGGEVRDNQFWGYVRDKGIGIEAAYLNQIFLPFERLHNDDTFPGNGFGLAAVDRIVRRHFGQTWVESKFGDGATFYFTLPSESN
jgi:signal transduction histidine kinase